MSNPREFYICMYANGSFKGSVNFNKPPADGKYITTIAKSAYDQLLADAREMQKALDKIANEDYRGNRPNSAVIAYEALKPLNKKYGEK